MNLGALVDVLLHIYSIIQKSLVQWGVLGEIDGGEAGFHLTVG
jgi:hypothetical protein